MSEIDKTQAQTSSQEPATELAVPDRLSRERLPVPASGDAAAGRNQPTTPDGGSILADIPARTTFINGTHTYICDYIKVADQKATFFFTGATALLAFLYKNDVSSRWLRSPADWRLLDIIAFVAMVALALGALLALSVIIPRTPGSRRGFIFWEAIAEYGSGREYADDVSTLSPATLVQIKAEHCFDLAKVCRAKYKWLRVALWVCAVGLTASLAVFLFLSTTPAPARPQATPAAAAKPTP